MNNMHTVSPGGDTTPFPWRGLFLVLLVALVARALLLLSGAVSFHSDEAVVSLMARHILQGARPTFFYGQAYMGSLDPWLVALGFRLLGESVLTVRIVQSALYLAAVALGFVTAWRFSGQARVALAAGLLLAVPTVNTALYTTATLGGYNELLILGTLTLLLGYEVTHGRGVRSPLAWALLGLAVGLGWWTHGLIVIYAVPVGLYIGLWLVKSLKLKVKNGELPVHSLENSELKSHTSYLISRVSLLLPALAALAFVVGSAPWWVFDFEHDHAALSTYLRSSQQGEFEGIGIPYVPPGERAVGLAIVGIPALVGMRFPWSGSYFLAPIGLITIAVYAIAIFRLMRGKVALKPGARPLLLGMLGFFIIIFIASTFGADPTGRYFLPLNLPLAIAVAALVVPVTPPENPPLKIPSSVISSQPVFLLIPALLLTYHAAGQITAASTSPGITTQFDLISHIPNDHDAALIAFLDEEHLYSGYTNYWVAFRLAFLSGERMQYSAALPYKANLSYNAADNRYAPYTEAPANASRIAVITTSLPELDTQLEATFRAGGVTYQQTNIGPYHIYYDFDPPAPTLPKF